MVTALTATEISMLQDKMLIEYTPTIDGEPRMNATRQADSVLSLCDVVNLVQEIADSKGDLCIATTFGGFRKRFIQHTGLSKALATSLRSVGGLSKLKSEFELHPYVDLMLEINERFLLNPGCLLLGKVVGSCIDEYVAQLNSVVDVIRSSVKSKELIQKVKNYQRLAIKNYESARLYVKSLFRKHAKIMVVRVDLSYGQDANVDIETVQKDRERLFANAKKNQLFKEMVGFIWKMEYGILKGFHHHVILFFDGSKVREDVTYAKMIGEYWKSSITKGKGLYYNCNAVKSTYVKCGIGLFTYRDNDKMQGLYEAVRYLTLTDKFIKIKMNGIRRTFGKGQVKERPVKRGRPRIVNVF